MFTLLLPMATMTTPKEAKILFANAMADFPAITGSPTDNDVKKIREVLTNILQSIDVSGSAYSLSDLLDDDGDYQS